MSPKVSIIMPTRDRADYVERAIRSVAAQSFENWELIVIDDSLDSSIEHICQNSDRRVKYHRRPMGLTAAEARDLGVALADGFYLAFLDSDDWWDQNRLSIHVNAWRHFPTLGLSWDTYGEMPEERVSMQPLPAGRPIPGKDVARTLFKTNLYNFIPMSSMFTRREIVLRVGFPKWTLFCDYALSLLICETYPALRLRPTLSYHDKSARDRISHEQFDFEREMAFNRFAALRRRPAVYWKEASLEVYRILTKIAAGLKNRDREYTRKKISPIWPLRLGDNNTEAHSHFYKLPSCSLNCETGIRRVGVQSAGMASTLVE